MIRGLSLLFVLAPALSTAQTALPAQPSGAATAVKSASTWKIDQTRLRSENHFDAEANPTVTFRSTKFARLAGDSIAVAGNLNMTWNRIAEGTAMLGDEVKVDIDIAAVEQPQ